MLATILGVAVLCGGSAWALGLPAAVPGLATALAVALGCAVLVGLGLSGSGTAFAPCSKVTLLRGGVAAAVGGLLAAPSALAQPLVAWGALTLALVALALDGVDGWLARRRGEATAFGARFDMEVDAALTLLLAGLALAAGKAGVWVLALGTMRYGFVAASAVWPWLAAPLPHSLRRKTVCVVQVAVLAVILAPVVPQAVSAPAAATALGLLAWSFALDVLWLWRHRPGRRVRA
ncbi:MAG: CDP-alcohol phosphatidyltransferase family protein [Alkalilacustris sp.]